MTVCWLQRNNQRQDIAQGSSSNQMICQVIYFQDHAHVTHLNVGCDTVYAVGAKGTVGRSGQPSKKYGARGVLGAVSVDLENIYSIVKEAKALGSHTALRVVNRMITKNFFLYGSISLSWKEMRETFEAAANKAVERVNKARKRILESSCAKEHFQGNLGNELGLDGLVLLNKEYARAKQCVYRDASSSRGENANSTDSVLGEELINDVKVWLKKRKSILNGETKGENTMLEKPPAVRDKEGENGAVYDESEYQDNGSVLDLNVSVENDNSFEAELEDALNWD
ncbi:hypothetical protein KP509_21G000700 [Ceratopteris richardii]|uniref:Uncharacterized protein n=1 Tax=Ceratopteris richardii TaxID=49495 RepID=A0A8T2S9T7_CERRI|nr:hypothetical protein KP509_21G000700 [Ceratopteris richardii]